MIIEFSVNDKDKVIATVCYPSTWWRRKAIQERYFRGPYDTWKKSKSGTDSGNWLRVKICNAHAAYDAGEA